jgi:hypothetical protein
MKAMRISGATYIHRGYNRRENISAGATTVEDGYLQETQDIFSDNFLFLLLHNTQLYMKYIPGQLKLLTYLLCISRAEL